MLDKIPKVQVSSKGASLWRAGNVSNNAYIHFQLQTLSFPKQDMGKRPHWRIRQRHPPPDVARRHGHLHGMVSHGDAVYDSVRSRCSPAAPFHSRVWSETVQYNWEQNQADPAYISHSRLFATSRLRVNRSPSLLCLRGGCGFTSLTGGKWNSAVTMKSVIMQGQKAPHSSEFLI